MKYKTISSVILFISVLIVGCGRLASTTLSTDYTQQLKTGIVNGVQLGVDGEAEIINKLGSPPKRTVYPTGAIELVYGDVTYGISKQGKLVVIINYSKNFKLCGVNVGMSVDDARSILGKPVMEGSVNPSGRPWQLTYESGQNSLDLFADNKDAPINQIIFAQLSTKNK